MSYSFTILASSRETAKAMVGAKLDEVAAQQPVHRADRDQALAAACAFIDVCDEPGDQRELSVSVHGSVSWNGQTTGQQVTGAAFGVVVSTTYRGTTQV
jgi:hypothetical protein